MMRLRPITEADGCYALAALAFHHPQGLAYWAALLAVWPKKPGQPPNLYLERYTAQAVEQGVDPDRIAEAECVEGDSVRRRVRRGFEAMADPPEWTLVDKTEIEVLGGEEAAALVPGPCLPAPADPHATNHAWNMSLLPDWDSDERNERQAARSILQAAGWPGHG
jgi:hypothetical protein